MNPFVEVLAASLTVAGVAAATGTGDGPAPPPSHGARTPALALVLTLLPAESPEEWVFPQESRDPGYQLYRDGYKLVLDEKWGEARKKFGELIRRYPRSSYLDDARFWTAFSWKFSDRTRALDEYARFMKDFPTSNYFDDAVSEYQRLGGVTRKPTRDAPPGTPEAAFRMAELEKKLAEIQERLIGRMPQPPGVPAIHGGEEPRIRRKVEALRALTRSPADEKAFAVLKETALDPAQPMEIRMVALDGARRFRVPDVGEFLLKVVRTGQDTRFRMMALDGLRATAEQQAVAGPVRSLALDQQEPEELRMCALQVLERGDRDQFPKVLAQIAQSDRQKRLQISALQYLSRQQEGDRKESADVLQEVALDRSRDPAVREIALFGLRQLAGPQTSTLLIETAKTDPQERVRLAAVYSLGASFENDPGTVRHALEELAADRRQPRLVRQTALSQLGEKGKTFDVNFLAGLASGEPDEEIQQMAIHVLGKAAGGTTKTFAVLTSLYGSIPDTRTRSKDVLLFSVASIGNDEAVDFLASVAKSDGIDALRERAVYYLGNIGTEKARGALLDILRQP